MPTQSDLRYSFQPLVGKTEFEVVSFELKEELSQPFKLTLKLISFEYDVDFGHLLDKPVLFTICDSERPVRYVHGLVSSFSQGESGFPALTITHWSSRNWPEPDCARTGASSSTRPRRKFSN